MDAKEALSKSSEDGDALEKVLYHVGEMGRYQKLLFLSMLPIGMFFAFIYFVQMFIAATPQNHWCRVPELEHLDIELRRNLSAPGAWTGEWDKCRTFDTNWTEVLQSMSPPNSDTPTVPCQHGWEFHLTDIPYHTVVSERGWVCENSGYVPATQAVFFVGSFFGGLFFGWLADRCGRVPALVGSNLIGCIGGVATTFTTGLWDYAFCRFLVGLSFDSVFMMMYILLLEYVGPSHRTIVANMSIALFFGGGCILLPWLALWIANWKSLLLATSLPMLCVLLAPWCVPESARWLMTKGRLTQAIAVLKRFERVNGTKIPEDVLDEFIVSSRQTKVSTENMVSVFRSPPLRTMMLVMMFVYMACAIIFDSLVRMSENLGLDFFVTFTLTSATEIPSITLLAFILDRWGRRNLTCIPLTTAAVLIFVALFFPKGIVQTLLAVMARFFINMSYNTTIQWTAELLPTGVRALGSCILHVFGYLTIVVSPYIVYSERVWVSLPLVVLGGLALCAGGAAAALPETRGCAMPQTIADSERLVREHSLCGKPEHDDIEVPNWNEKEKALIT